MQKIKKNWVKQFTVSALVTVGAILVLPGHWLFALGCGVCAGLVVTATIHLQNTHRNREQSLVAIEKQLTQIQTALKKSKSSQPIDTECIIVQEINTTKNRDQRNYFLLTDSLSESDCFKLIANTDQFKDADRIQAIFPSQPNKLFNRAHSHFISKKDDKSFSFPPQLINFN